MDLLKCDPVENPESGESDYLRDDDVDNGAGVDVQARKSQRSGCLLREEEIAFPP